jgi:hypothetical protein
MRRANQVKESVDDQRNSEADQEKEKKVERSEKLSLQ